MQSSLPVGRNVQKEARSSAHGFVIEIQELARRLDAAVLGFMPEPARTDGDIALSRQPFGAASMTRGRLAVPSVSGSRRAAVLSNWIVGRPACLVGVSGFVADPSNVRPYVAKNDCIGLKLADHFPGLGPFIVGSSIDRAFLTGSAVE